MDHGGRPVVSRAIADALRTRLLSGGEMNVCATCRKPKPENPSQLCLSCHYERLKEERMPRGFAASKVDNNHKQIIDDPIMMNIHRLINL
jgi:hypothetical protein